MPTAVFSTGGIRKLPFSLSFSGRSFFPAWLLLLSLFLSSSACLNDCAPMHFKTNFPISPSRSKASFPSFFFTSSFNLAGPIAILAGRSKNRKIPFGFSKFFPLFLVTSFCHPILLFLKVSFSLLLCRSGFFGRKYLRLEILDGNDSLLF